MNKHIKAIGTLGPICGPSRIFAIATCLATCAQGATIFFTEGFETDGGDEGYSFVAGATKEAYGTSINDYFYRATGDVGSNNVVGVTGDYWFAVEDTDSVSDTTARFVTGGLSWTVDISGTSDPLFFWGDFAVPTNSSWPANGMVYVEANIDGGGFTKILQIVNGAGDKPALDFNFDGIADGPTITNTLTRYTAPITGNGSTLELHVIFSNLTGSSDDMAIDQFVIADEVPEPSVGVLGALGLLALLRRSRA